MYIRAGMNAFLDPSAGKLDTISAEPLRTWHVTGTDEALEAFRVAVGGVIVPDEDVIGVIDAAVLAEQIVKKTKQVDTLQVNLNVATVELTDLKKKVIEPVLAEPALAVEETPVTEG